MPAPAGTVFHDKVEITDITHPFVILHFLSQLSFIRSKSQNNITKAYKFFRRRQTKEFGDKSERNNCSS
ncbi:hypothetical protein A7D67_03560 [Salmonella enterica]|nr:hypothetical protein [Salmonella enterica]